MNIFLGFVSFVTVLLLAGCGTTRDTAAATHTETNTHTVETVEVKAPVAMENGTTVLGVASVTTTTTDTRAVSDSDLKEHATTRVDVPPVLSTLVTAATGATGAATPWGMISGVCGAALTAVTGAYAAHKSAQSTAERQRADEHKADAAEGWEKAQAYALQVTPKAPV
jgi:hypothetical protein